MANEVKITVSGEDKVSSTFKDVKSNAGALTGSLSTLAGVAGGVGLEQLGEKALDFGKDAMKAAEDAQASQALLKNAVADTGQSWDSSSKALEANIALGEKYGFSANETRDNLTRLETATGNTERATRANTIAMDLARAMHLDYATAAKLVGKVTDGNITALNRMGIIIPKHATDLEALDIIQKKVAGSAQAYGETAAGAQARLGVQVEELKVKIGEKLLPIVTKLADVFITKVVPAVGTLFDQVATGIDEFRTWADNSDQVQAALTDLEHIIGSLNPLVQAFINFLKDHQTEVKIFAGTVGAVLVVAFTAWAISAGLAAAATLLALAPVIAVGAAIGLLAVGIYELVTHWDEVKAKTLEVWNDIYDFVKEKFALIFLIATFYFESIKNEVTTAISLVRDIIRIVMAVIHGDWGEAWDGIKQLAGDAISGVRADISLKLGFIRDAFAFVWPYIQGIVETAVGAIAGTIGRIGDAIQGAIDWVTRLIDKISSIPSVGSIVGSLNPFSAGGFITGLAGGGMGFGQTLVGEHGPEIVDLPRGARVHSNANSKSMANGGGSVSVYIDTVNAGSKSEAEQAANNLGFGLQTAMRARGLAA